MNSQSKKLVIVVSGAKQAGKNTAANQIAALRLNALGTCMPEANEKSPNPTWHVDHLGQLYYGNTCVLFDASHQSRVFASAGIQQLSFATPLKEFCINTLGLRPESCWGSNINKNALTNLYWDGLPMHVRKKYSVKRRFMAALPRKGRMTAREVMQVFGTDIMRAWYGDIWANACYRLAVAVPENLVLIPDARFPNEIGLSGWLPDNVVVKKIRLLRDPTKDQHPSERALDNYPLCRYDLVVPRGFNVAEQGHMIQGECTKWFAETKENNNED